ncbi:gamma-glutamyl-gamma-aminobutyrate hydrolase family protein [Pseudomarimonas salicorniae]|uniref:Gamma-glutamyl-gamma-aminobutyrate hydrolase family protein n=1 Tax=Pseudomarimonas salicorniae TaxID=2933270 RepID=A0ABT0GGU3_9GAMM|nr:gamma-glutamyl-gamma-aminobutyrate hydrolase family protein [Lysobacter sp. CAU 1642]MCK7593752.1 gamma-glutamyl-gamma-aminobutyrate hydrolase family protein [Lysobacter sp. CAU 1642]
MPRLAKVAVPADRKMIGPHPFQSVGEKYLRALHEAAGVWPLPLPSPWALDTGQWLDEVDGLFLTGSHSNIEPRRFGAGVVDPGFLHDPERDEATLSLIPMALQRGLPVFAVCRGLQEVNVAFGGSLLQKVHETTGYADHREDTAQPLEVQYAPAHPVNLAEGGWLAGIAGSTRVEVNSLHGQGIERLGRDLLVEARADDGLIEAVRHADPDSYLLAVQWHPEWRATENPFYAGTFRHFGDACRRHQARRR